MDFLEKLQQKPLREKKRIVWMVSGGTTFIIFLLWLSFFSVLHSPSGADVPIVKTDVSSSFSLVIDNLKRTLGVVKAQFGRLFSGMTSTTSPEIR